MVKKHTARLSLKLLGGFELRDPSGASIRLPTRNAKALLAYLAVQPGQPHSREKLMALLWGERSDKQARHSLNQTLVHIRKAAVRADDQILDSDRECIAFVPGSVDVDVSDFRELAAGRPSEAMDLYAGPFLDGLGIREVEFENWLSAQRSEFHALACQALKEQCERCVTEGRYVEAIEVGKRLVTLDPLCEEIHRKLMRLYDETGDRTSALKQYQSCAAALERELDRNHAALRGDQEQEQSVGGREKG
jgi:DNA-binding SARP family transcriptional activator